MTTPHEPKAGKESEIVIVTVGDVPYKTKIDKNGVQRFLVNKLLDHVTEEYIDLNELCVAYCQKKFTQQEYLDFYTGIGYSVSGLSELSFFSDLDIINPLWK